MQQTDPDPNIPNSASSYQYNFYGITGQRLVTVGCTNPSANPLPTCTVQGQNVYYGRKLLVSNGVNVVTDRLGSVRANTQGEKFAYYPYGEERTVTPDGRDKFGTYFRDGVGQDYAMARYYGSGTGRFWSPDPTMDSVDYSSPQSWNAYAYVNGDPINFNDPDGLDAETCGGLPIGGTGPFAGQTVAQVMQGTTGNDLLAQIIWHEGGTIYASDLSNTSAYAQDLAAIGTAVLNQWDVADGRLTVYNDGRKVCPLGRCGGQSLAQVVIAMSTYKSASGQLVPAFNSSGQMLGAAETQLQGILATALNAAPLVTDTSGLPINQGCEGVLGAITTASGLLDGSEQRVSPDGLTLLFWNQAPANSTTTFPGSVGYTGWRDSRTAGETFWGLSSTSPPPLPAPPVRRPPVGGPGAR
jgi:RHS repeat-associated protein